MTVAICAILVMLEPLAAARPAEAQALRVGLFRKNPPAVVRAVGPCLLGRGPAGECRIQSGKTVKFRYSSRGVLVEGLGNRSTYSRVQLKSASPGGRITLTVSGSRRAYRGEITIRASRGTLLVVNRVDLEDYMRSVLPSEMPYEWPAQALAAQAVVTRSFAVGGVGRHAKEGFDLCDLTHCQVYQDASWERPEADAAVQLTAREVLTFHGRCVPAPFHSTCGGRTTDGLYAGHSAEPYLKAVADARGQEGYCAASNHYNWSCTLTSSELARALEADGLHVGGTISDVRVLGRDGSGRATDIEIRAARAVKVTAYDFMMAADRHLGWNKIKSTLFEVRKSGGKFVFTGKGLGHGMGLCQWGARSMAEKGHSHTEILRHYFPRCCLHSRTEWDAG